MSWFKRMRAAAQGTKELAEAWAECKQKVAELEDLVGRGRVTMSGTASPGSLMVPASEYERRGRALDGLAIEILDLVDTPDGEVVIEIPNELEPDEVQTLKDLWNMPGGPLIPLGAMPPKPGANAILRNISVDDQIQWEAPPGPELRNAFQTIANQAELIGKLHARITELEEKAREPDPCPELERL